MGLKRKTGVFVVTHGSKLKEANWTLFAITRQLRRRLASDCIVPCFMELGQPDIPTAIRKLIQRGCNHLVGYAFFLVPGKHLQCDIPRIVRETLADQPGVTFELSGPMLEDPALVAFVEQRLSDAMARPK